MCPISKIKDPSQPREQLPRIVHRRKKLLNEQMTSVLPALSTGHPPLTLDSLKHTGTAFSVNRACLKTGSPTGCYLELGHMEGFAPLYSDTG